jgi:parvulin-like peptidyl-prolyl isomerase
MKIGLSLSLLASASLTPLWSQATSTPAAPAAQTTVKPHGPEAIAAQDPSRVVATINGQKMTAKQVLDMLKPFPPEQRKQIDANLTNAVQQIYTRRQLAEAAEKLDLGQKSPWKEQLELTRQGVLASAYIDHMSETAAKEPGDDPQKYYDAHKADYEMVKLSGIFVPFTAPGTPANNATTTRNEEQAHDKANDLEKKLKAGGDFSALARAESEHQTASKGGDLGTVPINDPQVQIPQDVKTAVAKLQPGQVSEPIRIPGAFLIVKLDSRETTSFAQAKPGIEQKLQNERKQGVVKKELDKYAIHVDDPDFFETGAAPANPKIPSLQRPAASATPQPRN